MTSNTTEKLYHSIRVVMYKENILVHEDDRVIKNGWQHTVENSKSTLLEDSLELIDYLYGDLHLCFDDDIIYKGMCALEDEDTQHVVIEFRDSLLTKAVSVECADFYIETSLL